MQVVSWATARIITTITHFHIYSVLHYSPKPQNRAAFAVAVAPSTALRSPLLPRRSATYRHRPSRRRTSSASSSMEALLGFRQPAGEVDGNSNGQKLVPWLNWDEWEHVRASLFSDSPDSVAFALKRISTWRSRGCLPVTIEVTASIIKIQQKDPAFRANLNSESEDEEVLAMLYSMAVMRLVNGLIEKTRRKTEVSIAEAARKINMPRMLIDIRHEASHRDLPSLRLLRQASTEALDWLKSYYWEPQKEAVPFQGGDIDKIREEIRRKLHELALGLRTRQSLRVSSSEIKKKRSVIMNKPCRGCKFLSCTPTSVGSRKRIKMTLKSLVHLYAFFSSEVVSILLEFLLVLPNPLAMVELPDKYKVNLSSDVAEIAFKKWKPVITKFAKEEPEILPSLLSGVADMIEARQAMKDGQEFFSLSVYDDEIRQIGVLSSLFSWLVEILKELRALYQDPEKSGAGDSSVLPKSILLELVRRCLLLSGPGNSELHGSALLLVTMFGDSFLKQKLSKLTALFSSLGDPDLPVADANPSDFDTEERVQGKRKSCIRPSDQEKDVQEAFEKVERLKRRKSTSDASHSHTTSGGVGSSSKWSVVESWKPCPIGMLPRTLGSSGRLPTLDHKSEQISSVPIIEKEPKETSGFTGDEELRGESGLPGQEEEGRNGRGKRGASSDVDEPSENTDARVDDDDSEDCLWDCHKGRLLMNGVFQRVEEEELERMKPVIWNL